MSLKLKEIVTFDLVERMFASSGAGMVLVCPEGKFLDTNGTSCTKLGYTHEQMLQMKVADLTHPDDLADITRAKLNGIDVELLAAMNGVELGIATNEVSLPEADKFDPTQRSGYTPVKPRGRILVLEDDATVRTLASAVLKGAGYTVIEASNPLAVLSGAVDGNVDLILSDVMMPEMSGPEFSEIWLDRHPQARFVFMSGYFDSETLEQKLSGKTLIQKPFRPSELLQQVSSAISRN